MACQDCGDTDARVSLGEVLVCDRCFDRRIAEYTGFRRLPETASTDRPDRTGRTPAWPPVPDLAGADGHRGAARRPECPLARVTSSPCLATMMPTWTISSTHAETEIGRLYLQPATHRAGWDVANDEVAGRLVWAGGEIDRLPYNVVVDGRTLTWDELGRALESFEGWEFRVIIEDRVEDARTDADVIDMRPPPDG